MTKHVWLVVDAEGNTARDFTWNSPEEAEVWRKEWVGSDGQDLHVVRATYEWPKGGKR